MTLTSKAEKLQQAREHAISRLKAAQESGDTECAHIEADDALCELLIDLGFKDVVDEWEKIHKWFA